MEIIKQSKVLRRSAGVVLLIALACESESPQICDPEREVDGSICLEQLSGQVLDDKGIPVPDLPVTVCGPICFYGVTNEAGEFTIELKEFIVASEYSVQPHGSPTQTTFYYPLVKEFSGANYDAGILRVLPFPTEGDLIVSKNEIEPDETAPAQKLVSGPIELDLGAGTLMRLSVIDVLEGDEGRMFRATELTPQFVSEFAPQLEGSRVIALGPFEAEISWEDGAVDAVSLSFENSLDWPPESEVSVLALGTYLDATWLAPAEFQEIGVAMVSEDGARIDLPFDASASGLRYLTWLALSPRSP